MGERKEKSLATLTKKFLDILKTETSVDLNVVSKQLSCSKKRRIYDVSNVLEGIGLIKRTHKNHYTYFGKLESNSNSRETEKLDKLQEEKKSLEETEMVVDVALSGIKSNIEGLFTHKSYLYLNHDDLLNALGGDNTILLVKDFKLIKLYFEKESEDSNLINTVPQMYINGYLIRPVQLKLINSQKAEDLSELDNDSLSMLQEVVQDNKNHLTLDRASFNKKDILKQSSQLRLFKTGMKQKKLKDHDRSELTLLAENVLAFNKYKGKSKFQYISDNNLVLPDDYENPGLISVHQPAEDEYAENYSTENPSVHDLYDIDVQPLQQNDHEMVEEEIEYIIEELDEEMLHMLQ